MGLPSLVSDGKQEVIFDCFANSSPQASGFSKAFSAQC
jgi:hypothetical protein